MFGQNMVSRDQESAKKQEEYKKQLKKQVQQNYGREIMKTIEERSNERQKNAFHKQTRAVQMGRNSRLMNHKTVDAVLDHKDEPKILDRRDSQQRLPSQVDDDYDVSPFILKAGLPGHKLRQDKIHEKQSQFLRKLSEKKIMTDAQLRDIVEKEREDNQLQVMHLKDMTIAQAQAEKVRRRRLKMQETAEANSVLTKINMDRKRRSMEADYYVDQRRAYESAEQAKVEKQQEKMQNKIKGKQYIRQLDEQMINRERLRMETTHEMAQKRLQLLGDKNLSILN